MKRFISILFMISLCSLGLFAQTEEKNPETEAPEEEIIVEQEYVYEQNGPGDHFLKISLLADFPLNFNKQLYIGGGAELSYFRFLTNTIALGGEISVAYNVSIGEKPLITVPMLFGFLYQPYINKFEFPLTLGIGISSLSCQGMNYFPALTLKAGVGAFYRFNENWSAGLNSSFFWIPQWVKNPEQNDNGLFQTAEITVRYHF